MTLFESPILIVVIGVTTAVVLGGIFLQTGKRSLLPLLAAVLALTAAGILLERAVETDREQVETTLHQIARDVERNDLAAVLAHIHSQAPEIRQTAAAEFPLYDFEIVSIKSNLQIEVDANREPKTATAEFNVVVMGSRGELVKHRRVPRFVTVKLKQEDGAWRLIHYDHQDPTVGFKKR